MALFELVVQILASISAIYMCFSPAPSIYQIHKNKSTGHTAIAPLVAHWGYNHSWLLYGIVTKDLFPLVVTYIVGDLLNIIYLFVYFRHTQERRRIAKLIMLALGYNVFVTTLTIVGSESRYTIDLRTIVGFIAVASGLILFVSPLATIAQVIRTKSSASIPFALIAVGTASNLLWLLYGLMIHDLFISIPCGAYGGLGLFQLVLYAVYHPSHGSQEVLPTIIAEASTKSGSAFSKFEMEMPQPHS